MSYAGLLTHECNVQRTTRTADGSGGFTTTTAIIHRRVRCRFNTMSSKEYAIWADKLGTLAGFVVFMEAGRKILEGDILVKTDDSRQFDVRLRKNFDEQDKYLTLICEERGRKVT
jgi:head-tail adaptor